MAGKHTSTATPELTVEGFPAPVDVAAGALTVAAMGWMAVDSESLIGKYVAPAVATLGWLTMGVDFYRSERSVEDPRQ